MWWPTWTDPYDNPSDPTSDPAEPPPGTPSKRSTITSGGPAFRLSIPDPTPTGPEAQPLTVVQPEQPFAFAPNEDNRTHQESATHHVGDTLHHLVYYTATGTSRFAELFEQTETTPMTVGTPVTLGSAALGLNGASVAVTIGTEKLDNGVDFSVDESARTVTLLATAARPAGSSYTAQIDYQPTVTVTGEARAVEVLSTARPKAPVISQVVPAWQLEGPSGSVGAGGISVVRTGGFLRVYLERPWYTSGAGELLGVVTTVTSPSDSFSSTFPTVPQQSWVTMMGIDPINYVERVDHSMAGGAQRLRRPGRHARGSLPTALYQPAPGAPGRGRARASIRSGPTRSPTTVARAAGTPTSPPARGRPRRAPTRHLRATSSGWRWSASSPTPFRWVGSRVARSRSHRWSPPPSPNRCRTGRSPW